MDVRLCVHVHVHANMLKSDYAYFIITSLCMHWLNRRVQLLTCIAIGQIIKFFSMKGTKNLVYSAKTSLVSCPFFGWFRGYRYCVMYQYSSISPFLYWYLSTSIHKRTHALHQSSYSTPVYTAITSHTQICREVLEKKLRLFRLLVYDIIQFHIQMALSF